MKFPFGKVEGKYTEGYSGIEEKVSHPCRTLGPHFFFFHAILPSHLGTLSNPISPYTSRSMKNRPISQPTLDTSRMYSKSKLTGILNRENPSRSIPKQPVSICTPIPHKESHGEHQTYYNKTPAYPWAAVLTPGCTLQTPGEFLQHQMPGSRTRNPGLNAVVWGQVIKTF